MKKILSIVAIMSMLLLVLTGCVNINYEVTLNKDGSADVALIYGFEKEALQQLGTSSDDMTSQMEEEAGKDGYTVEKYSDDKLEGIKASKHFNSASELSMAELFEDEVKGKNEGIKVEKKGNKTVFSQNDEVDLTSSESEYASMVTFKYIVNLPVKAESNNATEVSKDGKTLTWELKFGEVNKIEFKAGSSNSTLKVVLIVVAAVAILCVIAVVLTKVLKKDKNNETEKNEAQPEETIKEENKEDNKEDSEE